VLSIVLVGLPYESDRQEEALTGDAVSVGYLSL
jgi:hypothetical protein